MQVIQCKHPSETEYRTVKLIDPVKVTGKHYAVAVDVYDERNKDIFMSFLNVLNHKDKVTLIPFGLHAEMIEIDMRTVYRSTIVEDVLSRKTKGLNTLIGVRYLEKVKADEHIMMTAGLHDSAPWNIDSTLKIKLFSPGNQMSENYCKGQTFVMDWDVVYFPQNGPSERLIRSVLDIKHPQYYDICISGGSEMVECPTLPYGGYREIALPFVTDSRLQISCMLHDGTFHNCMCEFQDDESVPYKSDIMKPCAMVE